MWCRVRKLSCKRNGHEKCLAKWHHVFGCTLSLLCYFLLFFSLNPLLPFPSEALFELLQYYLYMFGRRQRLSSLKQLFLNFINDREKKLKDLATQKLSTFQSKQNIEIKDWNNNFENINLKCWRHKFLKIKEHKAP